MNLLLDINKSGLRELLHPGMLRINRLAKHGSALSNVHHPRLSVRRLLKSIVVRLKLCSDTLHLEVTTGSKMLESLLEKLELVGDTAAKFASMDEVKWFGVEPVGFQVVNLETAVRGDPAERLVMFLVEEQQMSTNRAG